MAATKALYIDQDDNSSICDSTFENPGQSSVRKIQLQGGYECFFVKDPPPELQTDCSICLCLLREPHLMDCKCGTNFCRTCIEPVKVEGKPCPLCNSSFTTAIPNRQLERVLNEMLVYCSRRDFGCDWKGELVSLPQHLNVEPSNEERLSGCRFAALNCSHCRESILRKDIVGHEVNKCLQRPYSCDYCHSYESTCEDVTDNHWPICPFRPSPCPNECGVYPERHNLEKHLENDCPETTIPCPFSYAGCQERLPRREMPQHISENLAAHMSLQATSHRLQLETFQAALNSQRTHYEKQVEQFQQTLSLQASKYQKELCEIQEALSAQLVTSRQELKKLQETIACQGASHEQQMEKFQRAVQNLSSENESLKLQIQEVYSEKQTLNEELKRICELNGNLDRHTHTLESENVTIKCRVDQQAQKLTDLLKQSKSVTRTIQEIKKDQTSDKENHKSLKKELQHSISDFQRDSKSRMVTVQQEVGKLRLDMESLKKSVELCTQQMKDKLSELEKETKTLKIKLDEKGLSRVCPDAKMNPKPAKADGGDLQIQRIRGDISEIRSEMKETVKVHIGLVPLEVTMHNFRQHKSLSIDWFSSPFYTHPRGYKMCLNVDANGFGEGKGTHVSVFIYLMQGEFDNELKWPFQGTITVQALNGQVAEANPHYTVVRFDHHSKVACRVYNESRAASGQGMLKFIAHKELQHRFLVNDSLRFRITKVDFL